jgi:hypothetical protein
VISLSNDSLRVDILHPSFDRGLLGPRFCTGGYIYQVRDRMKGPLLAGPEYPHHPPTVVNGQGAPEVFQNTLYLDKDEIPERKMIIGVGNVRNTEWHSHTETHFGSPVEKFCDWHEEISATEVAMETRQESGGWDLSLSRRVSLEGRSVRSSTRLRNVGSAPFVFRWFAHPFFPLTADLICCTLTPRPNPFAETGFAIDADGSIRMRKGYDWSAGCFQLLEGLEGKVLRASQPHPLVGDVLVRCDFPLLKAALWANDRTFSLEPFHSKSLEPGEEACWSITYTFGNPVV